MDAETLKQISDVLSSIAGNAHVPVYVQEQARAARALLDPEIPPNLDPPEEDEDEDEPEDLEEDEDLDLRK